MEAFLQPKSDDADSGGQARSFDHCWNYFRRTPHPADAMEASCYALGFFLASWGMYRGSTYLFRFTNASYLQRVVELIDDRGAEFRQLDLDAYGTDPAAIIEAFHDVENAMWPRRPAHQPTVVLRTKVIMGTLGFLPAFDQYFTAGIRSLYNHDRRPSFSSVNERSVRAMADVYTANHDVIDQLATTTTYTFGSDRRDGEAITKAKVLDMWGFQRGFGEKNPSTDVLNH